MLKKNTVQMTGQMISPSQNIRASASVGAATLDGICKGKGEMWAGVRRELTHQSLSQRKALQKRCEEFRRNGNSSSRPGNSEKRDSLPPGWAKHGFKTRRKRRLQR